MKSDDTRVKVFARNAYQKNNKIIQEQSSELSSSFGFLGRKNKEKWDDILYLRIFR